MSTLESTLVTQPAQVRHAGRLADPCALRALPRGARAAPATAAAMRDLPASRVRRLHERLRLHPVRAAQVCRLLQRASAASQSQCTRCVQGAERKVGRRVPADRRAAARGVPQRECPTL